MSAAPITLGWREWLALPQLGIDAIKAKVDTGARTSCLHVFKQEEFTRDGAPWIRFWIHPLQKDVTQVKCCEAPVVDKRFVRDSGGHREFRPVILTEAVLREGPPFPIEITLSNRDSMLFRMLLGRTALKGRFYVDPARSFAMDTAKNSDGIAF